MTLRPTIVDPGVEDSVRRLVRLLQTLPGSAWVTYDGVEFAANVVLFVPFGLLSIAWGARWWHGILGGLATSLAIETWQLLFLPTRVADARDLVSNTLGAALGVGVALLLARWWVRSQQAHNRRHRKLIDSPAQ